MLTPAPLSFIRRLVPGFLIAGHILRRLIRRVIDNELKWIGSGSVRSRTGTGQKWKTLPGAIKIGRKWNSLRWSIERWNERKPLRWPIERWSERNPLRRSIERWSERNPLRRPIERWSERNPLR